MASAWITAEDTPAVLTASVSDDLVPSSDLVLEATSSHPALLETPQISIAPGASAAERTITLTPAPNASGEATVTFTLSDGTHQSTSTLLLTVTPVDDAPTLSVVATASTPEDTPAALSVTVDDVDDDPATLQVSASASSAALVDASGLQWSGSGSSRTLTVSPVAHAHGSTQLTLEVADSSQSSSHTVDLTVTPVDDPPEISGTSTLELPASGTAPLTLTVTDIDTAAQDLTVSWGSLPALLASVSADGVDGDQHTLQVTAGHAAGDATLRIDASDGTTTQQHEVQVTVLPLDPAQPAADHFAALPNDDALGLNVGANDVDTLSWVAETVATTEGGTATIYSDGTVDYAPLAGFQGADTFTYRALGEDSLPVGATVTMQVSGDMIWWVDSEAPADGDGSRRRPFQALASAEDPLRHRGFVHVVSRATPYSLGTSRFRVPDGATIRGWLLPGEDPPVLIGTQLGSFYCRYGCTLEDLTLDTEASSIDLWASASDVQISRVTATSDGPALQAAANPNLDLTLTDIHFEGNGALTAPEVGTLVVTGDSNILVGTGGGAALTAADGHFEVSLALLSGQPSQSATAPVLNFSGGGGATGFLHIDHLEVEPRVYPADMYGVYASSSVTELRVGSSDIHVRGGSGVRLKAGRGELVLDRFDLDDLVTDTNGAPAGIDLTLSGEGGPILVGDPLATAPAPTARTPGLGIASQRPHLVHVQGVQIAGNVSWTPPGLVVVRAGEFVFRHSTIDLEGGLGLRMTDVGGATVEAVEIAGGPTYAVSIDRVDSATLRDLTTLATPGSCGTVLSRTPIGEIAGPIVVEHSVFQGGTCPGFWQNYRGTSPPEVHIADSTVSGSPAVDVVVAALPTDPEITYTFERSTLTSGTPSVAVFRPHDSSTPHLAVRVRDTQLESTAPGSDPVAISVVESGPALLEVANSTLGGRIAWSSTDGPLDATFENVDLSSSGTEGISLLAADTLCLDAEFVDMTLTGPGAVGWHLDGQPGTPIDADVVGFQTDLPTTLGLRNNTATVAPTVELTPRAAAGVCATGWD